MWGPLSTGDLSLYRAKIYSLYCLTNSFFFQDKSTSWLGKNISSILPLSPNSLIFISLWQGSLLIYLITQLLWYIASFAHTSSVSFRNVGLIWMSSLLKFAAFHNLSATSEDSILNLSVSPWHLTWLQMTHGLSLGSGDVIALDLFGRVTGDVNDDRSGSWGFRFVVSISCLAPFLLYVA